MDIFIDENDLLESVEDKTISNDQDETERRLFIDSEIDETLISDITLKIIRYNFDDKEIPPEERKPIKIYIFSPGGSTMVGLGLIDCIKQSKTPVYTYNFGMCASMATVIFIVGHKRFSFPNSTFLIHDGYASPADSTSKLFDFMDFVKNEINSRIKKMFIENTNISDEQYEENKRQEWYFMADTAKRLGMVDYIIGENCTFDELL